MAEPVPVTGGALRFAIGHPMGLSSNSWRVWTERRGDVYVACRDNYREVKLSLHASGRWRMGFTSEAVRDGRVPLDAGANRAWEAWPRPSESLPDLVTAFRIYFIPSELPLGADQRAPSGWQGVIFVESAPPGLVSVATIFIVRGEKVLRCAGGPSITLACLPLGDGQFVHATVHIQQPPTGFDKAVSDAAETARQQIAAASESVPPCGRFIFFGAEPDAVRFIVEANCLRPANSCEAG